MVNNTTFGDLEPGHLWRVTLSCASLVPQMVPLKLEGIEGRAVYDVFAGKQVQPVGGMLTADCRNMPARVYAILPAAVARVRVAGPNGVARGETMHWEVQVQDSAEKAIAAAVPVRVRLRAADGSVLEEQYAAATSRGAPAANSCYRSTRRRARCLWKRSNSSLASPRRWTFLVTGGKPAPLDLALVVPPVRRQFTGLPAKAGTTNARPA